MFRFIFKINGFILVLILFSCTGEPYDKRVQKDKECVQYYESLVEQYRTDSSLTFLNQHEQFITADTNHRLIKSNEILTDSLCDYRGLRDYGKTIVVEVSLFKRNLHGRGVTTGVDIFERHFLIVGDWERFDVKQLLWCGNEKIISEMIIGTNSKLVVTHCKVV
ncbi:MAG: hypothetical protein HUJ25_03145 [Crocinitomicaceae bacterium]|nr:hypothetical protein [Crocinitomicaceae bacterium]